MSPIPTKPAGGPGSGQQQPAGGGAGGGGIQVKTPQQMQAQNAQQQRMQQQFKRRMQIADNLRNIKHVVIVMSGKGGVGKSTVAVNVAAAYAHQGKKVGLLDLDLTNPNVPAMIDTKGKRPGGKSDAIEPVQVSENLKVMSMEFFLQDRDDAIIWRGPIKMNVIHQMLGDVHWGELDLLVIDLPPGTGDEPLSIAQLVKDADGVVLVTTPQAVSVMDVRKSIQFVRRMDLNVLGVVENMSTFACPCCGEVTDIFGTGGGQSLAEDAKVPLLGQIPIEPHVVESEEAGTPYVLRDPDAPTAKAFFQVVEELKGRLKADDGEDAESKA